MEKMSFIFFIIIVVYLLLSFLKIKNKSKHKNVILQKKEQILNKKDDKNIEKNILVALVAAVATVMGEKPYVLKRIYLKGDVDERKSSWKVAARSESMIKRAIFK